MHQTKKGKQWYFGMKAHIGTDAHTGIVHSLAATAANASDVSQTHKLLHGEEKHVHADAGYQGADKRPELKECEAEFVCTSPLNLQEAGQDGPETPTHRAGGARQGEHPLEGRARVPCGEEPVPHRKCRYKGLAKNAAQLHVLFAMANLVLSQ